MQSCGPVKHFSGNGGKSPGTLTFARDSTLTWTNDGAIFQIFSSEAVPGTIKVARESVLTWTNTGAIFQIFTDESVPANSQAHRGTTVLDAGTYHHFQVNAIGTWTISIKAK